MATVPTKDPWNEGDLTKMSVTEFLFLQADKTNPYEGIARLTAEVPEQSAAVKGALVPTRGHWPEFNVEATQAKGMRAPSAKMSAGLPGDALRLTRSQDHPEANGTRITDVLESKLGKLGSLYYKAQEQPGSPADMRLREFGGRFNLGPVSLAGSRTETSQETMPEKYRDQFAHPRSRSVVKKAQVGIRQKHPKSGGLAGLDLWREWSRYGTPWREGENPIQTGGRAFYEGPLGPGTLRGAMTGRRMQDAGSEYGADVSYRFPLLGGDASLSGEWSGRQLPTEQYPTGQTSKWKVGGRWTKKF